MAAADTMMMVINNAIKTNPNHIRQVIHDSNGSVTAALDSSGILKAVPNADAAETHWVVNQLSDADNETILQAIDDALAAGEIARVVWSAGRRRDDRGVDRRAPDELTGRVPAGKRRRPEC